MSKLRDLSGLKVGRLTVRRHIGGSKWECTCACGGNTTVHRRHLVTEWTRSCGCLKRELSSKRLTIQLGGKKFGKLTVIKYAGATKRYQAKWLCKCECGNKTTVIGSRLLHGHTKSCGCLFLKAVTTHGMSRTPEYRTWVRMRQRCQNPNHTAFRDYGGRGIGVCPRWQKFENFLADMGKRPRGHSLDRINPNGNYEPKNCRWATTKQQSNNTRRNKVVTLDGKIMSLSDAIALLRKTARFSIDQKENP